MEKSENNFKSKNNKKDILLLLLYSPGIEDNINEPIIGRTRLVKMLFLFKKEIMDEFKKNINIEDNLFYQFYPWNFGPFSKQVYDDLSFFILIGFVITKSTNKDIIEESIEEYEKYNNDLDINQEDLSLYEEQKFYLTDKGIKFTENLYNSLSNHQKKLLKEFKSRMSSIPLRAILRYVYKNYPDMVENSKIKNEILNNN